MGQDEKNLNANTSENGAPRRKTWEAPAIEDASISTTTAKVSSITETAIRKNGS